MDERNKLMIHGICIPGQLATIMDEQKAVKVGVRASRCQMTTTSPTIIWCKEKNKVIISRSQRERWNNSFLPLLLVPLELFKGMDYNS